MPAATLTTTLSELNRLYGVYFELVNEKRSSSQEAQRAWTDYEALHAGPLRVATHGTV
jgi:hypothetical protein